MNRKLATWLGATILAAATALPAQAVPTNKSLTIGMTQEFESLNPLIMTMAASTYTFNMVGRRLMSINADWEYVCGMCETVPSLENGMARIVKENGVDKIVVDWKLKPGLKWGDGTPVTTKDFKLAWEIAKSPNVSVASKETFERIEKIELDAKDPLKMTTTFKEARYDFYQQGDFYPIPSHLEASVWEKTKGQTGAYEKQTNYTTDPTNKGLYPGPYVVKEIKLGSHIVLVPNSHWSGKKPAIQKILLKLIPNTQTLEANILSGTIDMISELGMTFDQAVQFDKRVQANANYRGKFKTEFRDGLVYEHIDLNLDNPFLQDVRVRKALVHAIDRKRLTDALFEGKQQPAISNIHPLDPYFSKNVSIYEPNVQKAEELLEAAGWKVGAQGYRYKDGKRLELTIMTTAGNKTRELVQQFLQAEWKKVGAAVTINNEPARVFFGETTRKRAFPAMAMYAWISAPDNPPRSTLHSAEIPTKENGWSGQNNPGWANAEADKLLEDIFKEFDFDKRTAMMERVQQLYTDEVPVIPLYLRAQIAVVPGNLKNFKLTGHLMYSSLSVEHWELSDKVAKTH